MINWSSLLGRILLTGTAGIVLSFFWLLSDFSSNYPNKPIGWVLFFVLGLPLYMLLEGLGEMLLARVKGDPVPSEQISWKRISIGTAFALTVISIAFIAYRFLKGIAGVP
jgi:hypothetical protein